MPQNNINVEGQDGEVVTDNYSQSEIGNGLNVESLNESVIKKQLQCRRGMASY